MSTTEVATTGELNAPAPRSAPSQNGRHRAEETFAADRGNLQIADRVVEKIAAVALGEVDQIGGAPRRVLGVALGSLDPDQAPQVDARIDGSVVILDVRCSVAYPASVARTTDRARLHLIDRIGALTGLSARQVDITVTTLTTATTPDRRELQ